MGAFNLEQLLNEKSKEEIVNEERRIEGNIELVSYKQMIPSNDNFYDTSKMMDLVQSIKLCGVMQPIILTENEEEPDMFDIVSGHRRREACKYLVEQELFKEFELIPCIIKEKKDTVKDELSLIMANRFRDKTDWEKMMESIRVEKLISEIAGQKKLDKNTRNVLKNVLNIESDKELKLRDLIAEILNTSSTQIARYKTIYNHLSFNLMSAFKEDKISISIAYETAGLSPEGQKFAEEQYEQGMLTLATVQAQKQAENAAKPIKGQIKFQEVEEQPKEEDKLPTISPVEEKKDAVPVPQLRQEKTEEEIYDEEQEKIDRDTKEKLHEMKALVPTHEAQKEIDVSPKTLGVITYTGKPYMVLLNKDYLIGDTITMKETAKGNKTGRYIIVKILDVETDITGIEEGYCIIYFNIKERHTEFKK